MASVARVRTIATGVAGTPWYVNMHFAVPGPEFASDVVTAVHAFWEGIKGNLCSQVTYTVEGTVTILDSATGQPTSTGSTAPQATTGTGGNNHVPPANNALIRLQTTTYVNGRNVRGRIFVPGLILSAIDDSGNVRASVRTNILSAAGNLTPLGLSVLSKTYKRVDAVSAMSVWEQFAVVRSRRD